MLYKVSVDNDMGHLVLHGDEGKLPQHISAYVYNQAKRYLDNEIRSYRSHKFSTSHYHIKPQFQQKWRYQFGNDIVDITWPRRSLDDATIKKKDITGGGWTVISTYVDR